MTNDTITITKSEYKKLKRDAEKWRKYHAKLAAAAERRWSKKTAEERKAEMDKLRKAREAKKCNTAA